MVPAILVLLDRRKCHAPKISAALRTEGYIVICTTDIGRAVHAAWHQPNKFQLLVTDVVLSGCSGLEVAAKVKSFAAGVKVLYLSSEEDPITVHAGLDRRSDVLRIPCSARELLAKVSSLLAPPAGCSEHDPSGTPSLADASERGSSTGDRPAPLFA